MALSFFLYRKDKKLQELNKWIVYGLMTLRFSIIFLVLFFLLSPVIKYLQLNFDDPIIILAQDKSESIGLVKNQGSTTPAEYIQQMDYFNKEIEKAFELKTYTFGEKLSEGINYEYSEKETDFTDLYDEISTKYVNYNVGALIIASDGIYNKGENPVYAAKDFSFPIYTVALGDTTKKRDLIVKNAYANRIAFLGDYFPVEVLFSSYGYSGEMANISISHKGIEIDKKNIEINRNDFSQQVKFDIQANDKGLQTYTIRVQSKEGEFNQANNSKSITIDVVDDKKKILILSHSVHPDIGSIRKALESNKNLLVEAYTMDQFKKNVSEYQLVIFHQLPSISYNIYKLFQQLKKDLIPSLFIVGPQTDVRDFNLLKSGIEIKRSNRLLEQSIPIFNLNFKLFDLDDKFRTLIKECPPLNAPFGDYRAGLQSDVLFFQEIKGVKTQRPLFYFAKEKPGESGKLAFLFGEGLWRWRIKDFLLHENQEQFDAFINKTIHYLSLDIKKERFMIYHDRIFNENEEIVLRAEFYNQSYELSNASDISLILSNGENKEYNYQFSRSGKAYVLNAGRLPVGRYSFTAKTELGGKIYRKLGSFNVAPLNVEFQDLTANHTILYQLSSQSNGRMVYPNELSGLIDELKNSESIKPISHSIIDLIDLIELKWIFFLLVFLLSVEWFMRKFFGAY